MKQVNLYEAKTTLSALLEEARAGEDIVIAKNGKPYVRLTPVETAPPPKPRRQFGFWGKYGFKSPDVFPEFTQEEIEEWENNPIFPDDKK